MAGIAPISVLYPNSRRSSGRLTEGNRHNSVRVANERYEVWDKEREMGYDEDEEWVLGVLMSRLIAGGAQPSGNPIIRRCSLFVARVILSARGVSARAISRAPRSRQAGTRLTGTVGERRRAQSRARTTGQQLAKRSCTAHDDLPFRIAEGR